MKTLFKIALALVLTPVALAFAWGGCAYIAMLVPYIARWL